MAIGSEHTILMSQVDGLATNLDILLGRLNHLSDRCDILQKEISDRVSSPISNTDGLKDEINSLYADLKLSSDSMKDSVEQINLTLKREKGKLKADIGKISNKLNKDIESIKKDMKCAVDSMQEDINIIKTDINTLSSRTKVDVIQPPKGPALREREINVNLNGCYYIFLLILLLWALFGM